jgi:hypothetical protein
MSLTLKELQKKARTMGIPYSGLRKSQLLNKIQRYKKGGNVSGSCEENTGLAIFEVFVKKYQKDSPFLRAKQSAKMNYDSRSITLKGYRYLIDEIIPLYENMYNKVVNGIRNERTFTPKASSGGLPIKINNSQQWAEAIIELQNNIDQFNRDFPDQVKRLFSVGHLTKECAETLIDACQKPCTVSSGILGKKCVYK